MKKSHAKRDQAKGKNVLNELTSYYEEMLRLNTIRTDEDQNVCTAKAFVNPLWTEFFFS